MSNVIPLRSPINPSSPPNPILEALDVLALALVEHDHQWTQRERLLYETAISYCGGWSD